MLAVRVHCSKEQQQTRRGALQVCLPRGEASLFEGIDPAQGTCAVPALAGVPIVVRRLQAPEGCQAREHLDNKVATHMHIKPSHGFAPALWAMHVGPCMIYRADGRDLTVDDVYMLDSFIIGLLDKYSEEGVVPERDITMAKLDISVQNDIAANKEFSRLNGSMNPGTQRNRLTLRPPVNT